VTFTHVQVKLLRRICEAVKACVRRVNG
jgi:hypothetical protein